MRTLALALATGAGLALACGDAGEGASAARADAAPDVQRVAAQPAPRPPPLPGFSGITLDGKRFEASSLLGRRALLYFFNPQVKEAALGAAALRSLAPARASHNFAIVGVAVGADRDASARFATAQQLDFPVVLDGSGEIARRLALRAPVTLVVSDAEGRIAFALGGLPPAEDPDGAAALEQTLREALRLPAAHAGVEPVLGERPRAPDFTAERIDGGELALASLRGKPLVLIFFLHTCPHCHSALAFLRQQLAKFPEAGRPAVVGVSMANQPHAVRARLASDGLDFLPVVLDPEHAIRRAYGVLAGVPDLFLIDAEGFVVARSQGWREERDPPLLRMRLARLAGQTAPMLLHATGYSGSEFCGVCHEAEHETWQLTAHASAFDTLVRHGADSNAECVGCHVVGWKQPGGFTSSAATPELEDVGCESCHGRGGPHLSPGLVQGGNYEKACLTCHDTKHSLGFEYARFLPRVSHAANAELARLPLAEKRRLMTERGRPRGDLLPAAAAHVGSEACRGCHAAEHATWSQSPHARAVASLQEAGKAAETACLACHVTAFGRPGGFPSGGRVGEHADLARVGCESCHGPGGDHVPEDAPKRGTIVSLGDKCDSCVILQICGSCHDEANDPGFEFDVLRKIEAQRHGTIEPGGAPVQDAARGIPGAAATALLEEILARDAADRLVGGTP